MKFGKIIFLFLIIGNFVAQDLSDTTAEERQIDKMVYKLYNLTYEEVLIIQPNFTEIMSKKNVGSKFWISLEIKKSEN